jgi:hypothetical protein
LFSLRSKLLRKGSIPKELEDVKVGDEIREWNVWGHSIEGVDLLVRTPSPCQPLEARIYLKARMLSQDLTLFLDLKLVGPNESEQIKEFRFECDCLLTGTAGPAPHTHILLMHII